MQMDYTEEKARFYRALSEPVRIRILKYILSNENCDCTCKLNKVIKKDQSVIFRHIMVLENAGILKTEKHGKFLKCFVNDKSRIRKLLE